MKQFDGRSFGNAQQAAGSQQRASQTWSSLETQKSSELVRNPSEQFTLKSAQRSQRQKVPLPSFAEAALPTRASNQLSIFLEANGTHFLLRFIDGDASQVAITATCKQAL